MNENLKYLISASVTGFDTSAAQINKFGQSIGASGAGGAIDVTDKKTKGLTDNLAKLAGRAMLTIPVWMALRGAMMSVMGSISDAATSLVGLDTALHNTKNELMGMEGLDSFLVGLRESSVKLAGETGVSASKVVETFRRFATAGIDAQTSLAGMNVAVKGSIATMDDSMEVARFLADVYNQMGDKITEVSGAQEKFNFMMGTVATLMPTNTFTMKEFMEAYKNFGGTAKAANLTLDQTFTLIATSATAMQRGARGGTQLASAFSQLSKNSEEIRAFLQKGDLSNLSQFEIFFEVLKKSAGLINQPGSGSNSILKQIEDMFGNRGGRDVKSLAATFGHVVDEFDRLNKLTPNERNAYLIERYGNSIQKMGLQIERMKQLRNTLIQTFVEGLTGTNDFGAALAKINDELERMQPAAKRAGDALNAGLKFLGQGATTLDRSKSFSQIRPTDLWRMVNPKNIFNAIGASLDLGDTSDALANQESQTATLELRRKIMRDRQKAGLPSLILAPVLQTPEKKPILPPAPPIEGETGYISPEQKISLNQELTKLGYNQVEIAKMSYDIAVKEFKVNGDNTAMMQAQVDYMKALNEESRMFSENMQSITKGGLSDILMDKGTFEDLGLNIGNAMRQGLADAFAGNITEQLFKTTNMGGIFGDIFAGIRHANDGIGGPIKSAFDYGSDIAYKNIVKAFEDGSSGQGQVNPTAFLTGGGGNFGNWSLPGFGSGGIMNQSIYGARSGPVRAGGPGTTSYGINVPNTYQPGYGGRGAGATYGQIFGVVGSSAMSGMAGAQGAGGMVSGVAGGVGSAMMGLASIGFAQGAAATATSGAIAASAPWLGPVGIVLALGAMIYSLTATTKKWSQTQTQETTKQVGSKIDITNKQLEWVNRNLVALRQEITYIMPESAYFSEKQPENLFALNSMRGAV